MQTKLNNRLKKTRQHDYGLAYFSSMYNVFTLFTGPRNPVILGPWSVSLGIIWNNKE